MCGCKYILYIFWHPTWKNSVYSDILFWLLVLYLAFTLTFCLASILTFNVESILAAFLAFYLSFALTFYLASILTFYAGTLFWLVFWHSLWYMFGSVRAQPDLELAIGCGSVHGARHELLEGDCSTWAGACWRKKQGGVDGGVAP